MGINRKYSFGDFSDDAFISEPAVDFSDSTIKGSCFAQQNEPGKVIFPAGMTGVEFERCNLDNVFIPPGNTLDERCSNRRIITQNDAQDWVVNDSDVPTAPVNLKSHIADGFSTDPLNIPADYIRDISTTKSEFDAVTDWTARATRGNTTVKEVEFWFKEEPAIVAEKTTSRREFIRVRNWNGTDKFQFDSLPELSKDADGVQTLKGVVTRYVLRGKVWRFRGE